MLRISPALKSAQLIAYMRAIECFISSLMSAWIAVLVSQFAHYEDDVPAAWKEYGEVNTKFFVEIGSPGGAAKLGPIGKDHQIVAALPPQAK
jgi:hypothetical protein